MRYLRKSLSSSSSSSFTWYVSCTVKNMAIETQKAIGTARSRVNITKICSSSSPLPNPMTAKGIRKRKMVPIMRHSSALDQVSRVRVRF
jgi:hypothetical protein